MKGELVGLTVLLALGGLGVAVALAGPVDDMASLERELRLANQAGDNEAAARILARIKALQAAGG